MDRLDLQQMYFRFVYLLASLVLLFASSLTTANTAPQTRDGALFVQPHESSINLAKGAAFVADESGMATISQMMRNRDGWQYNEADTPNLGVDARAYWFHQSVKGLAIEHPYLIEIAYPALDDVHVFFVQHGEILAQHQTGDHGTFAQRPIAHRNFLFPLPELTSNSPLDIFVRVKTSGAVQLPIYLWQQEAFWEQDQLQLMAHAFFIAILITIALYNLMLFLSMRDSVYLVYVFYIVSLTITQLGLRGLNSQLLAPDYPLISERMLLVSIGASVFFASLFARKFMSLPQTSPRADKVMLVIALISLSQAIGGIFLPYATTLKAGITITALACPILLLVGIHQWMRGVKVARFYTLAWGFYLVVQFAITLSKFGLIPRTRLIEYGPEIGASIEVILLSFALADRMNEERRKRYAAQHSALLHEKAARKAQEQALELQNNVNEELEVRVEERTQELRETLDELSVANEKLQSLSTLDGLTGVRNRRSFDETIDREWRRCAREKTELSLLMIDADHFKNVNDEYGHLAGDECLKTIARVLSNTIRRPADSVARFGGEEFVIVLPNTTLNGAVVIAERIRSQIQAQGVMFEGNAISLSVSIGISSAIPGPHLQPAVLLDQADQALYRAKENGRNQVIFAEMYKA